MPTARVHLLAKEFGIETKDLIILLNKIGIGGRKPQSALDDEEVARVHAAMAGQENSRVRVAEKTVVAKPVLKSEIGTIDNGKAHKSDLEFVTALLKSVQGVLEKLESRDERGVAHWINDLERKNRIPKPVGIRMHGIRIIRNIVIHESYVLSPTECRALDADWAVINEWWKARKIP